MLSTQDSVITVPLSVSFSCNDFFFSWATFQLSQRTQKALANSSLKETARIEVRALFRVPAFGSGASNWAVVTNPSSLLLGATPRRAGEGRRPREPSFSLESQAEEGEPTALSATQFPWQEPCWKASLLWSGSPSCWGVTQLKAWVTGPRARLCPAVPSGACPWPAGRYEVWYGCHCASHTRSHSECQPESQPWNLFFFF